MEIKARNRNIKNTKLLGLLFIYPEYSSPLTNSGYQMGISFSYNFCKININMRKFIKMITDHIDMLEETNPPQPPTDCGAKNCRMHRFFYDEKKLKIKGKK